MLRLQDGRSVTISAFQAPSGSVRLRYQGEGPTVVAADAGDYVYPADIRWDPRRELLYVKAQGVRPVPWRTAETILFEFDLSAKAGRNHQQVDPGVLPPECPASPGVEKRTALPNNAMQLTKGGWMRVEASSSASLIANGGEVVRPSQLIASVGRTWSQGE